jgi:hypothetical protein
MTDRKWRIVEEITKNKFYDKVDKYELKGYKLLPESFAIDRVMHYCVLMTLDLK